MRYQLEDLIEIITDICVIGSAPFRLDRVQPSMQAMSSRTLSELPWSCNLDDTC